MNTAPALPAPELRLVEASWQAVSLPNEHLRWHTPVLLFEWNTIARHGQCVEACNDFLLILEREGVTDVDIYTWDAPGFANRSARNQDVTLLFNRTIDDTLLPPDTFPFRSWLDYDFHAVVRVGDYLVDWTARQFDPCSPFPLVLKMEYAPKHETPSKRLAILGQSRSE